MRWHADRIARALPVVVSLAVFLVALEILSLELRAVSWDDLLRDVLATPARQLATTSGPGLGSPSMVSCSGLARGRCRLSRAATGLSWPK